MATPCARRCDRRPAPACRSASVFRRHGRRPLQPGTAARIFTGAPVPGRRRRRHHAGALRARRRRRGDQPRSTSWREPPPGRRGHRPVPGSFCPGHPPAGAGHCAWPPRPACPSCRSIAASASACSFTGDELVQPGEPLPPGAIYNSNRYALRPARRHGLRSARPGGGRRIGSTPPAMRCAGCRHNDLVITSGGVSVGEEDPRQASRRGRRRTRHVEDRHQAGQTAGFRQDSQAEAGTPGSSACRATRWRLSLPA